MTDHSPTIVQMVATRRLEPVAANPGHALEVVSVAERHVHTARILAGTDDLAMAFTAAYDGARKALAAVLAAHGLRVRPVGGAHRNTGVAAFEFVDDDALGEFEWMRQVRNATEYPDQNRPTATNQDVEDAIGAAALIVVACAQHVREKVGQ